MQKLTSGSFPFAIILQKLSAALHSPLLGINFNLLPTVNNMF